MVKPMAKKPWTDADFTVLGNHYRPGERHRDPKLKRWIYTGRSSAWGTPLWYRPPRFTRMQLVLIACIAVWAPLLLAVAYVSASDLLHRLRP
jgi:hypothetical protein